MNKEKQKIINFLKRNNFIKENENHYINKYYSVDLEGNKEIVIAFSDGYTLNAPMHYFSILGMITYLNKTHEGGLRVNL